MLQPKTLKKYSGIDGEYPLPHIPLESTSFSDHYTNIIRMYESSFDYYGYLPSFHVGYDYATIKLINLALPHGFSSKQSLLDLCCGCGTTLIYLGNNFHFDIIGVDLVKSNVNESKRKITQNNLDSRIRVLQKNVLDLDTGIGKQDIIFSEDSFSHIHDRKKLFQICYDLLNPQGLLVFSDLIKTENISDTELDKQYVAWCLYQIESYASYLDLFIKSNFKVLEAQDDLGIKLLGYHIQKDKERGDIDPREYLSIFKIYEKELVKKWGRRIYELRKERLMTYKHIWNRRLDYAFFILSK